MRDELVLQDIRDYAAAALEIAESVPASGISLRDQLALERALFIVGEAANRLSQSTRDAIDQPWPEIIGLRNLLAHRYETISPKRLVEIAVSSVPPLLAALP